MARPLTFGQTQDEQDAQAGGRSMFLIDAQARDDAKFERQEARALRQEGRAIQQDIREARQDDLLYEMRKSEMEKQKVLDSIAARRMIDANRQSTAAAEELYGIDATTPDSRLKLSEFAKKYSRVLDPEYGDKAVIQGFDLNMRRAEEAEKRNRIEMEERQNYTNRVIQSAQNKFTEGQAGRVPVRSEERADGTLGYAYAPRGGAATLDPLKAAAAANRERRLIEEQMRRESDEIKNIEEDSPAWINSTGAQKASDGKLRWGFTNKPFDKNSPEATPEQEEQRKKYLALKAGQEAKAARRDAIESQLEDVYMGVTREPETSEPASTGPQIPIVTRDQIPEGTPSVSAAQAADLKPGTVYILADDPKRSVRRKK